MVYNRRKWLNHLPATTHNATTHRKNKEPHAVSIFDEYHPTANHLTTVLSRVHHSLNNNGHAISPDGSQIALIMNVDGAYGIRTQPMKAKGPKPWFLTLGKSIKPRYVKWINNHRFVAGVAKSEKSGDTPYTTTFLYTGDIKSRKGRVVVKPKDFFRQFNDRVVSRH